MYNLDIPGWMPECQLQVIEKLAAKIPSESVMVEVGSYCGRSAYCWAKSVDPSVTVYCIDIWDIHRYKPRPNVTLGDDTPMDRDHGRVSSLEQVHPSLENFKANTRDCHNIVALQGASPHDFRSWPDQSVSLVFLDGLHSNPWYQNDLYFWYSKVVPGGIICGDDYSSGHSDVVWTTQNFASLFGLTVLVHERFWLIHKPPAWDPFDALPNIAESNWFESVAAGRARPSS